MNSLTARPDSIPLIPVRMLNEHVYCPRLAYLMWVQGEFAHNEYTVEGSIHHRRVDKKGGTALPEQPEEEENIHARSVSLSSERLGISQDVTHPIFRYRISYRRLFEVQARLLVRNLSGEIPRFPVFVTR